MSRRLLFALAFVALAGGGCTVSNVQGPQLRNVPVGFGFDAAASSSRRVLEDRERLSRRGYFHRADGGNASIILTEHAGAMDEDEIRALHADLLERWGRSGVEFGELESHSVDDRDAWGWFERQERSRRFVLLVPYDAVTWTIDFYSSVAGSQDEDQMRLHATSFGLDPRAEERSRAKSGLALAIGLALLVIYYFRRQRQFRRRRRTGDFT